ncbi:growth arrest-specific protein 1 [Orussus abietinus]|uniref:growth arrest-specific protein 1 n=1 Tax=Orussus abietinus TaxID=222816 RepID=UPI0006257D29|nr:growth arrest-specific protein 1 [Orussus abietinus]
MSPGARSTDIVLAIMVLSTICTMCTTGTMLCDEAKWRCAFRKGCGTALEQYLSGCNSVLQGNISECPQFCQDALVALTSSDEGKELMTCNCARNDFLCLQSKQRVEVCRPSVTLMMNKTRVSCRVATWICNADALCSTALAYYNEFCRSMFHGKKCTPRCRNSINILRRQEKAAKLNTCICDGAEEYDCKGIHRNMNRLCSGKTHNEYHEVKKVIGDTRTNEILRTDVRGHGIQVLVNRTTLVLAIFLLLLTTQD